MLVDWDSPVNGHVEEFRAHEKQEVEDAEADQDFVAVRVVRLVFVTVDLRNQS